MKRITDFIILLLCMFISSSCSNDDDQYITTPFLLGPWQYTSLSITQEGVTTKEYMTDRDVIVCFYIDGCDKNTWNMPLKIYDRTAGKDYEGSSTFNSDNHKLTITVDNKRKDLIANITHREEEYPSAGSGIYHTISYITLSCDEVVNNIKTHYVYEFKVYYSDPERE